MSAFLICVIVLHLCHSIISNVLATCPPAVHLSFNGSKPNSGKIMDESGNNSFATMEDGTQVIPSGGRCGDGAASLNGMGFKCYKNCMNRIFIFSFFYFIFFACEFSSTNLTQYNNNNTHFVKYRNFT